jgi:hypothetical protein
MGLIKIWNIMINLNEFKSQSKALLNKFKIKDQSEKDVKLQG